MGEKPLFYIQTHSINDWSLRVRYEKRPGVAPPDHALRAAHEA